MFKPTLKLKKVSDWGKNKVFYYKFQCSILFISSTFNLILFVKYYIFAFFGMTYSFYFFVFCIIVDILFFDYLMEIILVIWEPIERITSALLFMLCVFYIYSALSFTQYRKRIIHKTFLTLVINVQLQTNGIRTIPLKNFFQMRYRRLNKTDHLKSVGEDLFGIWYSSLLS